MKLLCKDLDQLPEINPLIGKVVEDGLCLVTLVLNITDLHIQTKIFCNLPRAKHGGNLKTLCLLPFLKVNRPGLTVDLLQLIDDRPCLHLLKLLIDKKTGH
ncbi:MAG: hypothetical protein BWY89_01723 [Bacteroidetes bacterium ADurb.BinA012]|nr:MAG: hypothetical protein BWY89_01723 [Bacteroidetes bacterium ADurb.BinA012]